MRRLLSILNIILAIALSISSQAQTSEGNFDISDLWQSYHHSADCTTETIYRNLENVGFEELTDLQLVADFAIGSVVWTESNVSSYHEVDISRPGTWSTKIICARVLLKKTGRKYGVFLIIRMLTHLCCLPKSETR